MGLVVLSMNPFGYSVATAQLTQNALYRVIAPFYLSEARDDIVVVLLNDVAIDELNKSGFISANEWPIRYQDQANILGSIARHQPRAVFTDVYFKRERSLDDTLPNMQRRLAHYQQRYGTRFLFAGGMADEQLNPIQQKLATDFGLSIHGWSGFGEAYPLQIDGRRTVAYELYKTACQGSSPLSTCAPDRATAEDVADDTALSVRWGSSPADPAFPSYTERSCEAEDSATYSMLRQIGLGLLNGLIDFENIDERLLVKCPYHTVIFADELFHVEKLGTAEEKERLDKLLRDKMVLFGVTLEGLNDVARSPAHGQLPGVMKHAMALDNLMHYGSDFTRAADDQIARINLWAWIGIVLVISGIQYRFEKSSRQDVAPSWSC
jgi:hypothetical protein